jgi:phospholipase C
VFQPFQSKTAGAQTISNTSTPIQHVVVIFQENVSFDHYFATYPNAANPGSGPIFVPRKGAHPTPTVNGLAGPLMTRNPNSVQPFRIDRSQAILCDQSHDYTGEQKAIRRGTDGQNLSDSTVQHKQAAMIWASGKGS